jgi:hypothetical protein
MSIVGGRRLMWTTVRSDNRRGSGCLRRDSGKLGAAANPINGFNPR